MDLFLLLGISVKNVHHNDANRLFLDPDFLTIEDVSLLLRCSPDTVYRIHRDELPRGRPGKHNIYLRDDVIRYVRLHCRVEPRPEVDELLSEIEADLLESPTDGVRERSHRRTR